MSLPPNPQVLTVIIPNPNGPPHLFANPRFCLLSSPLISPLPPTHTYTHLIHLGLGLLQSPVTGEVWRRCRGATLPGRAGRGGGGSGSRPEKQERIKTQGLEPPALRPGLRPSTCPSIVPPILLFGRTATRWVHRTPSGPTADELRDLEGGPLPHSRPQFPRTSNEGDLPDAVRAQPGMTDDRGDRGGAGRADAGSAPSRGHRPCGPAQDAGSLPPARSHGRQPAPGAGGTGGT